MNKLLKRQTLYLLIILLILLTFWFLHSNHHDNETTEPSEHLKRDYVLFDDTRKESPRSDKKIISPRNEINIYKQTLEAKRLIHIHNVYLKTLRGKTPIFVYSAKVDNMISGYVKDYGTWEEDLLNQTGIYLLHQPDTTFIDIGCNIGVYTLFAAKLGMKVFSIDPVENNLVLLSKSVDAGRFAENVTLVLNAVSDEYKSVVMNIPKDNIGGAHIVDTVRDIHKDNIGGAHIVDKVKDISKENVNVAETILLDDLIPYIRTENVFIKMDVEGHEWNVLNGGHQFFQAKDVKVILMEWVHHRHSENGRLIIEQLIKNGFLPYTDIARNEILEPDVFYTWPENVFWIKR
ncbi:uncharacterized protein LOC123523360 [Mercenaria mercenaria]|uniref:uncharacterized protein LOC123523360 n=1 Tax=Mercenaria mercenaria TaxID=6596 RepID=UPI00234EA497|nr:uncharacterized protein LOC123523360 [Mercenaria mercenaria]